MSASFGDRSLTTLRSLIAIVDSELATSAPSEPLRAAWAEMVRVLALGSEPEMRSCPYCHELGMRGATRCSRCWSALPKRPGAH